jgi:DNA invertase Pin-like site-specific DNA recombinase
MTKFVSYLRVSTARQGRSGLGLAAQRDCIGAHLQNVSGKLAAEFTEIESGKRNDRPELARALATCRIHGAVLIVAKLDRLARNNAFVANLLESGCEFVAADFPQANRMMLQLMSVIAEYEAKLISDRTRAALAQAAKRGVQVGGYANNCATIAGKGNKASAAVRSAAAQQRARDLAPVMAELRSGGAVSLAQIAGGLNSRGITTARGSEWTPAQVSRIMQVLSR